MNHVLTRDEIDALDQVNALMKSAKPAKPGACIARNAKHLVGIKYLVARKDGSYALTGKGNEALLVNQCVTGLRALSTDPTTRLDTAVAAFLGRKGHIAAGAVAGEFTVTAKGLECLADIALNT